MKLFEKKRSRYVLVYDNVSSEESVVEYIKEQASKLTNDISGLDIGFYGQDVLADIVLPNNKYKSWEFILTEEFIS